VHFSFSTFFSVSRYISCLTMCLFHFPCFSVFLTYSRFYSVYFSFFTFLMFPAIFHVLECMFLFFHDFQVSIHTPGHTVSISHISSSSVFLAIFQVKLFLSYFLRFSIVMPYSMSYNVHFSFSMFFSVSCHISGPTLFVSHFPRFLVFSS